MKQFFTLLTLGLFCLSATHATAQFSQNFDINSSFTNNCWEFTGFFQTTTPGEVINGTASLYSNPPVSNSGAGSRTVATPYLTISSTSFLVSFNYKLNGTLNGNAVRMIEVGLQDRNGVFTPLDIISMDKFTANLTQTNTFAKTFTLASTGVRRLVLRFSGTHGDGNTRMIVDDLLADATATYSSFSTSCNSAPTATDNNFTATSIKAPYAGTSVLTNDSDPDNETLTATLTTPSPDGTVVLNPNGTFTFTPNASFTGSFTTFTYTATDDGYDKASTTASVFIHFTQVSTLPVALLHFSGTAGSVKTTLDWNVAANETGAHFEVQRSQDGRAYQTMALLFTTEKSGTAQYRFADAAPVSNAAYRLKVVNKDGTWFYSPVVSFNTEAAAGRLVVLQNPVQGTLRFAMPATAAGSNNIRVYNSVGMVVHTEKMRVQKGNNSGRIALQSQLPPGVYVLEATTAAGRKTTTCLKQ